jgi:hypothetical protein
MCDRQSIGERKKFRTNEMAKFETLWPYEWRVHGTTKRCSRWQCQQVRCGCRATARKSKNVGQGRIDMSEWRIAEERLFFKIWKGISCTTEVGGGIVNSCNSYVYAFSCLISCARSPIEHDKGPLDLKIWWIRLTSPELGLFKAVRLSFVCACAVRLWIL